MLTRNRDGFSVICITLCEVFDGMVFESLVDHNKDQLFYLYYVKIMYSSL